MKKYIWKTHKIVQETQNSTTIFFDTKEQDLIYFPGQFLNLKCVINGEVVIRSYSFSSSPSEIYPAITIKRVKGGKMSNFIIDNADQITEWEIEAPFGNFVLNDEISGTSKIVFLSGGSGIAPLFSMLKSLNKPSQIPLLIYSNKSPEETIFFNQLEDYQLNKSLDIYYSFTNISTVLKKRNNTLGRFTKSQLKSILRNTITDNTTHYFICGPNSLMDLYKETLLELNVSQENMHLENFDPKPNDLEVIETNMISKDVIVNYYEDNFVNNEVKTYECTSLIEVQPNQSLLEALKEHHIKVPNSCNNGSCGVCWATKTNGKIKMLHNGVLTQKDIEAGLILLCQSYPLNEEVCITIQ